MQVKNGSTSAKGTRARMRIATSRFGSCHSLIHCREVTRSDGSVPRTSVRLGVNECRLPTREVNAVVAGQCDEAIGRENRSELVKVLIWDVGLDMVIDHSSAMRHARKGRSLPRH